MYDLSNIFQKNNIFKVSISDEVNCTSTVVLDMMRIHNKTQLQIVNTLTNFTAAKFAASETLNNVRRSFLKSWKTVYTGILDNIRVDHGFTFTKQKLKSLISNLEIELELSQLKFTTQLETEKNIMSLYGEFNKKVDLCFCSFLQNLFSSWMTKLQKIP